MNAGWQLENLLNGIYVDSTRIDHPGRFDGDYPYRVADITVEEEDSLPYRALKRLGAPLLGEVRTEFVFDEAYPEPEEVRNHPRFEGLGAELEALDDRRLRLRQPITGQELYGARLHQFNEILEDI